MSQFWTFFDQNGSIFLSVVVPPPPTHNTLNYNRLSIILISLLFWVRVNPNPDTVAELTLTCRGSADPTRQAAAIPKTFQPARLLRQPCHPALLSAHLLHPPGRPAARPPPCLPACSSVSLLACLPHQLPLSARLLYQAAVTEARAHTRPHAGSGHGQPLAPRGHSPQ